MNLAWHNFRKDARQFRLFLAIWFGLVLLDLAVNLGWVGRVGYSSARGFDRASNTWTSILPGVIWALVGLLPSLAVLADSPARRDGFLATRPLPKRDLFLSKLLFVFALIVAPWVLQECIHLAWAGTPSWVSERGTLERLMYALPVALACAGFAALWPNPARWARAIGIILGCYVLAALAVFVCEYFFKLTIVETDPIQSAGVVSLYALAAALVALAIWHSRGYHAAAARWGVSVAVVLVSQIAVAYLQWRPFKLQPANPSLAKSVMAEAGVDVPPRDLRVYEEQGGAVDDEDDPKLNISVQPKTKSPPDDGVVIGWAASNAKLLRVAGGEVPGKANNAMSELFTENPWNYLYRQADFLAWATEFPKNVMFYLSAGSVDALADVQLETTKEPASPEELTQPVTVQADLQARVFQWRKIADLPLTPGATATNEFGLWKFVGSDLRALYLERRQISLSTASDSRCSSADNGPLARMAWMVYDPAHNVVWLPDNSEFDSADRGAQTALVQYCITLHFDFRSSAFKPDEAARCRLFIFEKTWLGSVPEPWKSGPFTLGEKIQPSRVNGLVNNQPMSRSDFDRRTAAVPMPAPDASAREVSRYLLALFQLENAFRHQVQKDDPEIARLARFVPTHLDLFLDALPVANSVVAAAINAAIKTGATDAQKATIIAAVPQNPALAAVLLDRGWTKDARRELYQLADSTRALPVDAMRAIASFQDPQTYPRLLGEFQANPNEAADDFLWTLPGLRKELDNVVARHWRTQGLVLHTPGDAMFLEPFILAMRHGETNALARVYQVLDDPEMQRPDQEIIPRWSLSKTVRIPGLTVNSRDYQAKALAWMRQHRPEDFVFDPALREFVLKQKP